MAKLFSKKNKGFLWLIIILAVGFGALTYFNQQFVLISNSYVETRFENGQEKAYWITALVPNKEGESFSYTYNPKSYGGLNSDGSKTLSNGDKVIPKNSFSLTINNLRNYCDYRLDKKEYRNLIFFKIPYYEVVKVDNRFLYDVASSKSVGKQTIDGLKAKQSYTFQDNDGKGVLILETATGISLDCPDGDNVIIVKDGEKVSYYDRADFQRKRDLGLFGQLASIASLFSKVNVASGFNENFVVLQPDFSTLSNTLTGTMGGFKYGGGSLATITADQEYFDSFVYILPKGGQPKITNFEVSNIGENSRGTATVTVENAVANTGNFVLTSSNSRGSINPSYVTYTVMGGNAKTTNFVIGSGEVVSDTEGIITVKVCDSTQSQFVGAEKCDTKTKTYTIKDGVTKSSCGNGNCETGLGENYLTCQNDCKQSVSCELYPNTYLDPNSKTCQCLPDFEKDEKGVCAPSTTNFLPFLIIGLAILFAVIIIVLTQRKR